MKRLLLAVFLVLALTTQVFAGDKVGNTADAAITSGKGYLRGIIVNTDGTNPVTITAYDNASAASGNKLFSPIVITTASDDRVQGISFEKGVCEYFNGIYVDITTTGTATYDVFFEAR